MSHAQPMQPDAATGIAPVSAGTLFYLWADRLLEPAGMMGSTVLLSGARVSAKKLAPLLWAVSFARLQADGALHMEEFTKKTMGIKKKHVKVTPAAQPGYRGGFENEIVQRMVAGDDLAYYVVWKWFGGSAKHPEGEVFALAKQETVQAGLARVDENARSGVSGLLLGKADVEPLPERINATWGQFQQFQAGWESFQRNDPSLAETLLDTCRKAIRNRQEGMDD